MTHPDYRALCAELLAALESWSPSGGGPLEGAEEQQETALIARARAALDQTQPPPDGEVAELVAVFREVASEDPDVVHIDPLWLTRAADLLDRLAQPEPVGVTDEELLAVQAEGTVTFPRSHPEAEALSVCEYYKQLEIRKGRAVLQRYARPAITPIPVSERLPGAGDCDAEGRCWWHAPHRVSAAHWIYRRKGRWPEQQYTHWLPVHALPLPGQPAPDA
jgi:hypothetical protein